MPTWIQSVEYLQSRYEAVTTLDERTLAIDVPFTTPEGVRPERVYVEHIWFGEPHPHMIKVTAPVATLEQVDLAELARSVDQRMLGGIAVLQGTAYVVNSLPIDSCELTGLGNVVVLVPLIARSLREEHVH